MSGTDRDDGNAFAVPDVCPAGEVAPHVVSFTVEVEGELFAVRPAANGGTDYTWLSGQHEGYGFGSSGASDRSMDEHRESVRTFLAQVDPATGYVGDD